MKTKIRSAICIHICTKGKEEKKKFHLRHVAESNQMPVTSPQDWVNLWVNQPYKGIKTKGPCSVHGNDFICQI